MKIEMLRINDEIKGPNGWLIVKDIEWCKIDRSAVHIHFKDGVSWCMNRHEELITR
jgi:hypothetical protein